MSANENSRKKGGNIWIISKNPKGSGTLNGLSGIARLLSDDLGYETVSFQTQEYSEKFRAAFSQVFNMPQQSLSKHFDQVCHFFKVSSHTLNTKMSWEANQHMFQTYGFPDIMLTDASASPYGDFSLIKPASERLLFPASTFVEASMQYLNWGKYSQKGKQNLVPHHMTQEILDKEAEKLRSTLPIGKPLIAIVIGSPRDETLEAFGKKLEIIQQQHPDALLYFSSCHRTDTESFIKFCASINHPDKRVFDWHSDASANNPYKGFLKAADHMIVVGESHSMVSERLYAGRAAHIYYEPYMGGYEATYYSFQEDGHVINLKTADVSAGLITPSFEPVDVTRDIADALKTEFLQHQSRTSPEIKVRIPGDPRPDHTVSQMIAEASLR